MPGPTLRLRHAPYLLAAAGLALLLGLRKTLDLDLFWHMAIGRAALATRSTLPREIFSFSAQGAPWPYKDLVADIVFYKGFHAFGYPFYALLKALCALALGGVLLLAGGRRHLGAWLLLFGVLLSALAYRFLERPLIFSLVLFPLQLHLCQRVLSARAAPLHRRTLARLFLPLIGVQGLWAQLHREAALGLAVLAGLALYLWAAAAGSWLSRRSSGASSLSVLLGPPPSPSLLVVGVLTALGGALASLANPSGAALLTTSLALTANPVLQRTIFEWRPFSLPQLWHAFPVALLLAAAAIAAVGAGLVQALRRRASPFELWHAAWLALLAVQALRSVRWLPQLVLCAAIFAQHGLGALAHRLPRRRLLDAGVAAAVLALVVARSPYPFGLGEAPDRYPGGALAFARQAGLHPRVANAYDFGGYLLYYGWPGLRVLIDGRHDMVYPAELVDRCMRASYDASLFAAMRAEDGADWALAQNEAGFETFQFLLHDPAWALVYWSEPAAIYVRRDAYPALSGAVFHHLPALLGQPLTAAGPIMDQVLRQPGGQEALLGELRRVVAASPQGPRALLLLITLYERLGPAYAAERQALVRTLLTTHPDLFASP